MLRPVRTRHATTKEEVDIALASADQVIVEGDDELLSYAINKASAEPDLMVCLKTGGITAAEVSSQGQAGGFDPSESPPVAAPRSKRSITPAVLATLIVVVGAIAWRFRPERAPHPNP
jgi:hypothetical protein